MISLSRMFRYAFYLLVAVLGINFWLQSKTYLVNPKDVTRIALKDSGTANIQSAFANIEKNLRQKYKGHIISKEDTQWIFVNSGGWMGSMYILHASLTEYILFFGTAVDTSGHSGRYWANITDTIIAGSFRQWKEGDTRSTVYKPGDTIVHTWGEATAVQWSQGTWMVEYGRGFIPSTLPFALADTVFGTTDFMTLFYTFRIYCKALINEASFTVNDIIAWSGL